MWFICEINSSILSPCLFIAYRAYTKARMRTSPSVRRIETWNFICSRLLSPLPLVLLAVGQPAYPRGIYESKHGALIRFPPANRAAQGERTRCCAAQKKSTVRGNGRLTGCLISVDSHWLRATMEPYGDDRERVARNLRWWQPSARRISASIGNGWFCLCNWSIRLLSRITQSNGKFF